jgi:hypothetical protein
MSRIIFITSLTENYMPQAKRLLSSLKLLKSAQTFVLTQDFSLPDGEGYRSIRVPSDFHLPLKKCPQQGHLIELIPALDDNDVVIIADADSSIQRDLLSDEIYMLMNLGGRVGLSNNACEDQDILSECLVCRPKIPMQNVFEFFGKGSENTKIYNCGFIAAKPPVWRTAAKKFGELWPTSSEIFAEWRSCQVALCVAFQSSGIEVLNMGYGMHTQGHFPPQDLHAIQDGVLYYGNRPVFFVHHVDGFW